MKIDFGPKNADIWRGGKFPDLDTPCIPTGFQRLDSELTGGGWPTGHLTEILVDHEGSGALWLTMPALAQLSKKELWITWIAPPYIPYAPALAGLGIDLSKVLLVHPKNAADTLWAAEQAMRSGTCSTVFAWIDQADTRVLRRLQLAAQTGKTWGLLFRPAKAARQHSMASLRLHVEPERDGVQVNILKRRGGWPAGPILLRKSTPKTFA